MHHLKHQNDYQKEVEELKEKISVEEQKENLVDMEISSMVNKEENSKNSYYEIPEDCEIKKQLDELTDAVHAKILDLINDKNGTLEDNNKKILVLLDIVSKAQQAYTSRALFCKMKYRVAP